jgi:hypothetical protein
MSQNCEIMGLGMTSTANNRLSPYEFELTAEGSQAIYTYGQPHAASVVSVEVPSDAIIVLARPEEVAFRFPIHEPNLSQQNLFE